MRFCFGTVASLLNQCKCRGEKINQATFVARLAWVIDKKTKCLYVHGRDEGLEDDPAEVYETADDLCFAGGNDVVVSKLLTCTHNFTNWSGAWPTYEEAHKNFAIAVAPYILESKKPLIILALLDMIQADKSIDVDFSDIFEQYFKTTKGSLLYKNTFDFNKFVTMSLLYITDPRISNVYPGFYTPIIIDESDDSEPLPDKLTPKIAARFYLNRARNQERYEVHWNSETGVVTIVETEKEKMFNQIYEACNRRATFLEKEIVQDFFFESDMRTLSRELHARFNIKKAEYRCDEEIKELYETFRLYHRKLQELMSYVNDCMQIRNQLMKVLPVIQDRKMLEMSRQIQNVYWELDKQLSEL